jgi:hypothetical protein
MRTTPAAALVRDARGRQEIYLYGHFNFRASAAGRNRSLPKTAITSGPCPVSSPISAEHHDALVTSLMVTQHMVRCPRDRYCSCVNRPLRDTVLKIGLKIIFDKPPGCGCTDDLPQQLYFFFSSL